MARLPPELLSHVVDCLIPANPPIAFPADHVVTQTLLSLCLVSKTVHYAAIRRLFAHCMYIDYIDGPGRLDLLLRTLRDHCRGRAFGDTTNAPNSASDNDYSDTHYPDVRRENSPTFYIHSLFLAPYPSIDIDSTATACSILSLCEIVASSLTRLVIDMYLRFLRPEEDRRGVRLFLHAAFQELTALEEFVSTRDELYLDVKVRNWDDPELAVWSTWPNLRRLALYNVDVAHVGFLRDIQQCKALTHLVLIRSDGLTDDIGPASQSQPGRPQLTGVSNHLQRIFVVNSADQFRYFPYFSRRRWKDCFLGKIWNLQSSAPSSSPLSSHGHGLGLEVVRIDVPLPAAYEGMEADYGIELCQEWVRDAAIQGTLWGAQGTCVLSVQTASPEDPPGEVSIGWRRLSDQSGKLEAPEWDSDLE